MVRSRVSAHLIVATALCLLAAGHPAARAAAPPALDSLYARALRDLEHGTVESRRRALKDLDELARKAGDRTDVLHGVARAYSAMGHFARARDCLDRIAERTADDAEAQIQLGLLWKWEWLASLESSSYQKAMRCLLRGAKLAPKRIDPRVAVTALALARNDTALAVQAARGASYSDPGAVETGLAIGCAAYRTGRLAMADSVFRSVLPRLPDSLHARFTDLPGAMGRISGPGTRDSIEVAAWGDSDPDLTTPENEVRLDFWTRVAHAALLFQGPQGIQWDMRTELFARYGVPPRVELPPPPGIDEDVFTWNAMVFRRQIGSYYGPAPLPYPFHKQTWIYPELGIRAELWDRSLNQTYAVPVSTFGPTDPRPHPAALARRPDLVALDDGRGVYRALPPGVAPMAVQGTIARFPSERGVRLVAHLETQAEASDRLQGSWVVVDSTGREAARGSGALVISSCAPGEVQVAQFEAEVPPGAYRVHLSAGDGRRRGIVRLQASVTAEPPGLAMSDLVLLCRAPVTGGGSSPLLIEPDFDARLAARTASVYFEVQGLTVDAQGRAHFSYRYTLRAVNAAPSGRPRLAAFEASREEENIGPFRRQVVSAPIDRLAAGTYEFEVEVRDLQSGAVAARSVSFTKD